MTHSNFSDQQLVQGILDNLCPAGTFIGDYVAYNQHQESPLLYDLWASLWVLSSLLGPRVIVDRPLAPVNLNLYVVLVAESGVTRKSTAVRGASVCTSLVTTHDGMAPGLIGGKTTPEKLEYDLQQRTNLNLDSHVNIAISEMVTFFGRERYTQAMPGLLTDLYDCPRERTAGGSLKRGGAILRNVYVTLLTASTPSWLATAINPDIIEGGFTSRCLFVVQEDRKQIVAWPKRTTLDIDRVIEPLTTLYNEVKDRNLYVVLDAAAIDEFTSWYNDRKLGDTIFEKSFEAREDAHALKIAALLAINAGSFTVGLAHMRAGIRLVAQVKRFGTELFFNADQQSIYGVTLQRIRDILIAANPNGVRQSELGTKLRAYVKVHDLEVIMDLLHELEFVAKYELLASSKGGRKAVEWAARPALSSPTFVKDVLEALRRDRGLRV